MPKIGLWDNIDLYDLQELIAAWTFPKSPQRLQLEAARAAKQASRRQRRTTGEGDMFAYSLFPPSTHALASSVTATDADGDIRMRDAGSDGQQQVSFRWLDTLQA